MPAEFAMGSTDAANAGRRAVVEVRNLYTHYGDRAILRDVSLDIYENEILVIMGGSGSGKSTLLRHLMALEEKTSGHSILRRKRFTTIKIIDKKLESLVAEVLRGQTVQIRILERVNEIYGLIIDIVS